MNKKLITISLATILALGGCSNSDKARYQMMEESEHNYGVPRIVKVYQNAELIGEYEGTIDVEYVGSEEQVRRVDLVFFDGETPVNRVIISGNNTVIVENKE